MWDSPNDAIRRWEISGEFYARVDTNEIHEEGVYPSASLGFLRYRALSKNFQRVGDCNFRTSYLPKSQFHAIPPFLQHTIRRNVFNYHKEEKEISFSHVLPRVSIAWSNFNNIPLFRYLKNHNGLWFQLIDWRIGDRVTCDRRAHEIQLKENCTASRIRKLENGGKSSFSSRYVMPALCCPSHVQNRLMNLKWPCEFFVRPAKNGGLAALPRVAGTRSRQFRRAAKEQPSSHKNANFRTVLHGRAGARFSPAGYFFAEAPGAFFSRRGYPGTRHYGSSGAFRRSADSWQIYF